MWNQLNLFYYLDVADVVHNHLDLTLIEGEDACNFDLGAAVDVVIGKNLDGDDLLFGCGLPALGGNQNPA